MNRIPLRLRITIGFAFTAAVVLVALGTFVHLRLGASLLEPIDEGLAARADELAQQIGGDGGADVGPSLAGSEEEFAQVISRDGDVAAATPGFDTPLLSPTERVSAMARGSVTEVVVSAPREAEATPARLLARPVGGRLLIVGASLEDRADTLRGLLVQFLVGGPMALLLAAGAGYLLAGAALRPVEAMRRQAAAISTSTSGRRLPLPPARDEIRRLGATLNGMLERLDAGLRRERRFVAEASHELRTPLALIRAEVDLARRRPRTVGELESALRSVSEEVDRLQRLAEELLVLASAHDDRLPLRRTRFPVQDLLDGVAIRFAARARAANRTLQVGSDLAAEIDGDRLRLEQALGILIDNALRHGSGIIGLDAYHDGDLIVLHVSDEGTGFPNAFLAHAFEPFTRADQTRGSSGTGLGLAIVDTIAQAHNGRAHAQNSPEAGAEVTITIPRR